MLTHKKDIEDFLHTIANENENVWVCTGTHRLEHYPIIGYGGQCEVCEKIGNLEYSISEFEDEIKELNDKNDTLTDTITETKTELEETIEACEALEGKVQEKDEKLLEIFERYPECGI